MNKSNVVETTQTVSEILEANISKLIEHRQAKERRLSLEERIAVIIARLTGSMAFIYSHLLIVVSWVLINLHGTPLSPFDPTFVILATATSVEAIFLSTFVLMNQNRMADLAETRAELDLQISLLAEHEITKIIEIVSAMAKKMDVREGSNPELAELKQNVDAEKVLTRIEERAQEEK